MGYLANKCFQLRDSIKNNDIEDPTAFLASNAHSSNTNSSNNGWLLDSEAIHHVTHNEENLNYTTPYNGNDSVTMVNGFSLCQESYFY